MNFASSRTNFLRQAGLLACLVVFCALTAADTHAQSRRYRPPARYYQAGKPDQAEGRKIFEEFREKGIAGDYYLEFELRVLPRRGETQVLSGGRLWGGRNDRGPISRVELPSTVNTTPQRILVQNGANGAIWTSSQVGVGLHSPAGELNPAALFSPLAGTDITPFDLQMPFLYWGDFVFEGMAPVRGRPAHVFLLYPPDDVVALQPNLAGVRVFLDTQFGALVQFQQIGVGEKVLKSMTLLDLKKVDDQWVPKSIDFRDEATRNKTQFVVTGAAMGMDFSGVLFEPSSLSQAITPPSAERVRRLAP